MRQIEEILGQLLKILWCHRLTANFDASSHQNTLVLAQVVVNICMIIATIKPHATH